MHNTFIVLLLKNVPWTLIRIQEREPDLAYETLQLTGMYRELWTMISHPIDVFARELAPTTVGEICIDF